MSDLAVQCDNLCEHEVPAEAEKLRNQLSALHTRLGDFKVISSSFLFCLQFLQALIMYM
jgi:hypothetical protein